MSKYDIKELMSLDVLPLDANKDAEDYARKFKDAGLMVMMQKFREKEITDGYGRAIHYGNKGVPEIIFAFTAGICKHATVLLPISDKNIAEGSKKFY